MGPQKIMTRNHLESNGPVVQSKPLKYFFLIKNFNEKLDSIKKQINIWSSRGLSLYGKVTIIKYFLIPKFVYISSLLPTPNKFIKDLNQLIYKFLWNGKDKIRRVSAINNYEEGGMIDVESMIKSLRLAWLKRIFSTSAGTWKNYLTYLLKESGGFLLFNCNYNIKDLNINSQFYMELLHSFGGLISATTSQPKKIGKL